MKQISCFFAILAMGVSVNSLAADVYGDSSGVYFTDVPPGAQSMRLTGPQGFSADVDSLEYYSQEALPEGAYRYELYGPVPGGVAVAAPDAASNIANGRSADATPGEASTVFTSGDFTIDESGGLIVSD